MDPFDVSLAAAAGAGMLTFLSPCILPLVPAYLCFISGMTLDDLTGPRRSVGGNRRILAAGLAFVGGLGLVFVLMGAAATSLGQALAESRDWLSMAGGAAIVVLGLHYAGVVRLGFLDVERRIHLTSRPAGMIGAFVIGLAFGFGWTPCVGPVLSAILMVAGSDDSLWHGVELLAAFALGLGVPFLVAALVAGRFMGFLARFRHHLGTVEMVMGGLLVLTGLAVLTGSLTEASGWLIRTFPMLNGLN
ncbi:MAG: cytochrome c biogenesis protein CcdA [Alphaproteobacteria bacterium]